MDIRQQRYRHSQTVNPGVLTWTLDYQFSNIFSREKEMYASHKEMGGGVVTDTQDPIGYALVGEERKACSKPLKDCERSN